MAERTPPQQPPPKPDADRLARRAAALRENLKRRKAQARARVDRTNEAPASAPMPPLTPKIPTPSD